MYKKIYFIGIRGVGMAGLAIIAKQAGFLVSGSDTKEEFITNEILTKEKIVVKEGFKPENISSFVGKSTNSEVLIVVSAAHGGFDNIEATWAKDNGYKLISHGEALGEFMKGDILGRQDQKGIAVSGCHGKTTITAFLATVFALSDLDPSYAIGSSEVFPIGSGGHFGTGEYFIAEADEYLSEQKRDRTPKFLHMNPFALIINNIDFDHPDFYRDVEHVEKEFGKLVDKVDKEGIIAVNGDDQRIKKIIKHRDVKILTYGVGDENDFKISNFREKGFGSSFSVSLNGTNLGTFELSIPGFHNAKNSLAVIALSIELGLSAQKVLEFLPKFKGTKRRLEIVGKTKNGLVFIDDYAHHPEEIKKSLNAIKQSFPGKKIVTVFQAHTYSRTESLMNDFVSSFSDANVLIIIPTFSSKREAEKKEIDEKMITEFNKIKKNVHMIEDVDNVVEYVGKNYNSSEFVFVTMGAGNVYKIGYSLLKKYDN